MMLQSLRWVGVTGEDRLASVISADQVDVGRQLESLAVEGWVHKDPGPFGGWGLTGEGQAEVNRLVAAELQNDDAGPRLRESYETFRELNPIVMGICHDWQMRRVGASAVMNDHRDGEYDARVLDRLIRIHEEADRLLSRTPLERFEVHHRRLGEALDRSLAGEIASVADNLDSYHTVWFQLHEDLLSTLGISRDEERRRDR